MSQYLFDLWHSCLILCLQAHGDMYCHTVSVIVYKTQKQSSWRPLHLQLVSMCFFPSPSVWLFPSAAISFVYSATLFIHLGKLYVCLYVTDATYAKSTIHTRMWGFAQSYAPSQRRYIREEHNPHLNEDPCKELCPFTKTLHTPRVQSTPECEDPCRELCPLTMDSLVLADRTNWWSVCSVCSRDTLTEPSLQDSANGLVFCGSRRCVLSNCLQSACCLLTWIVPLDDCPVKWAKDFLLTAVFVILCWTPWSGCVTSVFTMCLCLSLASPHFVLSGFIFHCSSVFTFAALISFLEKKLELT